MVNRHEGWLYALAAVLYVALGLWLEGLVLNWIVGPTFPFLVVFALPRWLGRRTGALPRPARQPVRHEAPG